MKPCLKLFACLLLPLVAASAACNYLVDTRPRARDTAEEDGRDLVELMDAEEEIEFEIPPNCGNGAVDGGEECDDGNDVDGDGCDRDCTWTCTVSADCSDLDMCSGEETCNTESRTCVSGTALEDGILCADSPRSICMDGICTESVCGDGYVDAETGEFCDPPGVDGCQAGCVFSCTGDTDCPDDGNICNGEEYCNLDAHNCERRNAPPDNSTCEDGRVCCGGNCVVCCEDIHCDDENDCTDDTCSGGTCTHANVTDREVCWLTEPLSTPGICCEGECYGSAAPVTDCCSDEDCEFCRGTPTDCSEFSSQSACLAQDGCSWNSLCAGRVSPPPDCENIDDFDDCQACGCMWVISAGCDGTTHADCGSFSSRTDCLRCDCMWIDGLCEGAPEDCREFSSEVACGGQAGCHWAVCTSHQCW